MDHFSDEKATGFSYKRSRRYSLIIVLAIFVFGTIYSLSGRSGGTVTAQADENMLGVIGTYGDPIFVPLEAITQVQLADTVDFGRCVEGEETKNTMSGQYQNDAFGTYTLHVYTESAPYIVVTYDNGSTLVFNQRTQRLTRNIYEDLTE